VGGKRPEKKQEKIKIIRSTIGKKGQGDRNPAFF
jgi:hypothetical protein